MRQKKKQRGALPALERRGSAAFPASAPLGRESQDGRGRAGKIGAIGASLSPIIDKIVRLCNYLSIGFKLNYLVSKHLRNGAPLFRLRAKGCDSLALNLNVLRQTKYVMWRRK
jgi:hypothetical protein